MANIAYQPGKVKVDQVMLASFDGSNTLDITNLVTTINIWENVSKPNMEVDVFVADGLGVLYSFPIIGEEKITINLSQTNGDKLQLKLVVTNVGDFDFLESGKAAGYTLTCTGEEIWLDSQDRKSTRLNSSHT